MYRTHGVVVIVALIFLGLASGMPCQAADQSLITVTGEAEVRVNADEVIISLGVETSDKKIENAKKKNDQIVKRLIASIKKDGVPANYITTNFMHIQPRYKYGYFQQGFIGYFVRKTVVVTLKEISRFEKVLSDSIEAGANYVHGIQFRTTELRKHRDRARQLALEAAREKAQDMASALNQKVGKPYSIKETPTWWLSSYQAYWGASRSRATQNVIQTAAAPSVTSEGALSAGQIAVRAKVTVSFELEQPAKE